MIGTMTVFRGVFMFLVPTLKEGSLLRDHAMQTQPSIVSYSYEVAPIDRPEREDIGQPRVGLI